MSGSTYQDRPKDTKIFHVFGPKYTKIYHALTHRRSPVHSQPLLLKGFPKSARKQRTEPAGCNLSRHIERLDFCRWCEDIMRYGNLRINICSRIFEGYILLLLNSVQFPLFLFTLPGSCKKLNSFPMTGKDESICGSGKARLRALQSIICGFPAGFVSVCSPFGMGRTLVQRYWSRCCQSKQVKICENGQPFCGAPSASISVGDPLAKFAPRYLSI